MSSPSVSVALCTYEGARWLPAFLDGLAAQTLRPTELVVSDDGSSDRTLDVVAEFAVRAPFPVRTSITPARLGSTFNFAEAFAACSSALIAPADQDDVWAPRKLERMVGAIEARGLAMAFSDGTVIDDAGHPVPTTLWAGVGFDARERRAFARDPFGLLLRRSVVTGAAMVFRAQYLDRLLPFPPALNGPGSLMLQDRWIALVLAGVARIGAIEDPLIAFRRHDAQQTGLREALTFEEVAHQLRRSTVTSAEALTSRAAQLEEVRARLGSDGHPRSRQQLMAAIDHLRTRASLPAARWARLGAVSHELASCRYHRFSSGSRSAVADLLRPPD